MQKAKKDNFAEQKRIKKNNKSLKYQYLAGYGIGI